LDGIFQDGYSGSIAENSYNGYNITINPNFNFESYLIVNVDAYCQDFSGNIAELTWDFRIEDYVIQK